MAPYPWKAGACHSAKFVPIILLGNAFLKPCICKKVMYQIRYTTFNLFADVPLNWAGSAF